jgi:hypothetical protein
MTHLTLDHYPENHPGHTTAGNGFYTVVGVAAVSALVLLGIYWVAMDALRGVAAFVAQI